MSKKFLVGVDGSEHGWKALDVAAELAKASEAELLVVHVVPPESLPRGLQQFAKVEGMPVEEVSARYRFERSIGDGITNEAEARARKRGLTRIATRVVEGNPADQIVEQARSDGVDMLFLGSRGLGDVKGLLMGSVSHKVMHLAPCTCVAVK